MSKIKFPILSVIFRLIFLLLITFSIILYLDNNYYFESNNKNNHTARKWNSFYDFTDDYNVDIILVGNSHLYTGINPKNLSCSLGCNSFILASPGTGIVDHYFALKEALKKTNPKLVILETYGINNSDQFALKGQALSDQFKSFSSRKDFWLKLHSSPFLFTPNNIPLAWSNTLRNHAFILNNQDQIKSNIRFKGRYMKSNKKLYLGRYVTFTTGLEDSTLNYYKKNGCIVEGTDYRISEEAKHYLNKLIELCESKDVELVFLTVPMFKEHVCNYDKWKEKLSKSVGEKYSSDARWLNLQTDDHIDSFDKNCFENTISKNQHLTYLGSLLSTYKLSEFIKCQRFDIPNRSRDAEWLSLFYGEEGYFENISPNKSDSRVKKYRIDGLKINEEVLVVQKKKFQEVIYKVKSGNKKLNGTEDRKKSLIFNMKIKDKYFKQKISLIFDKYHSNSLNRVFKTNIKKDIQILSINSTNE